MSETQKAFKENKWWFRLADCVNVHIKKALLNILHNCNNLNGLTGVESDPEKLYEFLSKNEKKLKKPNVLKDHQLTVLLPPNKCVDSSNLDVTLIRFLIQTFCGIKNKKNNWQRPDVSDDSIAAFVYRAAGLRNEIFHFTNKQALDEPTFDGIWKRMKKVLLGLNYGVDIEPMRTDKLDHSRCQEALEEEFLIHLVDYKELCAKETFHDNYVQRSFKDVKNGNEINDLKSIFEKNDGIIVYAEAGMGKSMCAKYIRHKWSKDELLKDYKMIYFDSKLINQHLNKVPSNAAPLWFSEMKPYLRNNGKIINDFTNYECVKKNIDNLIVVIDGIDEFPIDDIYKFPAKDDYLKKLENKIMNNETISAFETIVGIYFGYFFPKSKICLFGRTCEFEKLNKYKDQQCSSLFDKKNRKNLRLLKFNDKDVGQFTCWEICKNKCTCKYLCREIYYKIKDCELCRVPTDLKSLIEMYQMQPNKDIGLITSTKLYIATLFNRLSIHTKQRNVKEVHEFQELKTLCNPKLIECIDDVSHISFHSLLDGKVRIDVKQEKKDKDGVVKFKYCLNDSLNLYIEREMLEELGFFYIKDLKFSNYILEPYHLTYMEFLAACYAFNHEKKDLLKLNKNRLIAVLPYLAGLHAKDNFTINFVESFLNGLDYHIDHFLKWLYGIENIRNELSNSGVSWYGLQDNHKLTPSISLLDSIHREHRIPYSFIPKTIVNFSEGNFEWYQLHFLKHDFLTGENTSGRHNIESFLRSDSDIKFLIKGNLAFNNDMEINAIKDVYLNNRITFRINRISLFKGATMKLSCDLKSNTLEIDSSNWCAVDNRLTSSNPTSTTEVVSSPASNFKHIVITSWIDEFTSEQIEKLFRYCLNGTDLLSFSHTFFTTEQLNALQTIEESYNKQVCIQLYDIAFKVIDRLPSFCTRQISFKNTSTSISDDELSKLEELIGTNSKQINSIDRFKIIKSTVPFIRRNDSPIGNDNSFYLHLYRVDFSKTSPEQFARTMSSIPSLELVNEDKNFIPNSHWEKFAETKCSYTNELRVWLQKEKTEIIDLKCLLKIKLLRLQLICRSKDELRYVLKHIPSSVKDRLIKIFVVRVDMDDWDYYDEQILLSGMPIKTFLDEYSENDFSFLDDNEFESYYEGELKWKHWCCELSKEESLLERVVKNIFKWK